MATNKDLQQYKEAVGAYAREGKDFLFHNEGEDHALIICTNIFDNATKHIRIVAEDLCNKRKVCADMSYVNALRRYLEREDSRLSIILTNFPSEKDMLRSPLFCMLSDSKAYAEGRVVIKDSKKTLFLSKTADDKSETINFCTGDDHMFRVENDVTNCRAIANFGDKKTTTQLNEVFDRGFAEFTEVDLSKVFSAA